MESNTFIIEFVNEFLKFKFSYVEHELFIKIKELMDPSPLMGLIKDRPILRDYQYQTRKIIDLSKANFPLYFKKVLEDILNDFKFYRSGPMLDKLPTKLLAFIQDPNIQDEGKTLNLIFDLIDLMNKERNFFKENDLGNILELITNTQTNFKVRDELFRIFKSELYKKNFDSLIPIIKSEDNSYRGIKMQIMRQLANENPMHSKHQKQLNEFIINSYEKSKDLELKKNLEIILSKSRRLCGNSECKALINLHKDFEEIITCNICGKSFCETCQDTQYTIKQCNYCNTFVCVQHYTIINLKNNPVHLCESCCEEGKYKDGQILCENCRKKLKKCNNEDCGRLVCTQHSHFCVICDLIYCIECAKKILISTNTAEICPKCKEYVVSCDVCDCEIFIGDYMDDSTAYKCDDCGKYLCMDHVYRVADWDKNYCEECMESWKDYVWQMKTEGH